MWRAALIEAEFALLRGWASLFARPRGAPTVNFFVHNRAHVEIFAGAARLLADAGRRVRFAGSPTLATFEAARAEAARLGFPPVALDDLAAGAAPGDLLCLANDWGPAPLRRALPRLRARGVRLIGVVEGCRFARPMHYRRVDEILCWGPSGPDLLPRPCRIVGSPVIERARAAGRGGEVRAVINYKFAYGVEDLDFAWGRAAEDAALAIDPGVVFSVHPASRPPQPSANVTKAPIRDLLSEAAVLISRPSTVVYQALAAGVPVLLFPTPEEDPGEFADPAGAFETARAAPDLLARAEAFAAAPRFPAAAAAFLARHVSFDPARSADQRIAAALADLAGAPPSGENCSDDIA